MAYVHQTDIFHGAKEAGNDEYLAHYQISFIYQQDITRSQFWEYQLKIDAKTQKIVCNKIGLKEKLISSPVSRLLSTVKGARSRTESTTNSTRNYR